MDIDKVMHALLKAGVSGSEGQSVGAKHAWGAGVNASEYQSVGLMVLRQGLAQKVLFMSACSLGLQLRRDRAHSDFAGAISHVIGHLKDIYHKAGA